MGWDESVQVRRGGGRGWAELGPGQESRHQRRGEWGSDSEHPSLGILHLWQAA